MIGLSANGQWRFKKCKKCNIVWNRDFVACLNLLKMWGFALPLNDLMRELTRKRN